MFLVLQMNHKSCSIKTKEETMNLDIKTTYNITTIQKPNAEKSNKHSMKYETSFI